MKPIKMMGVLTRLGYVQDRQKGSHRYLKAEGRPDLVFSYHGGDDVPPGVVRDILTKQIGMTKDEALEALR